MIQHTWTERASLALWGWHRDMMDAMALAVNEPNGETLRAVRLRAVRIHNRLTLRSRRA